MVGLTLVTAPASEPVSLAEAKDHCRIAQAVTYEDALVTGLIRAAREHVETYTHRALLTQTWADKRDAFPCDRDEALWLPMPPVSSVTSITYIDTAGTSQTWAASLYTTDLPSGPYARAGRIVPAYSEYYPATRGVINAVTIRFVCGYGATAATVPSSLLAAMQILIATWYGPGREAVNIGNIVTQIPQTVEALLWPFKAW